MATGLAFRGRIASVAALPRWRAALAARHVAPADVVCIGDSITEGTGATVRENRWLDLLQAQLRAAYPTALTPGGAGYIPAYTMADYPPNWGYGGNIAANGTFGLARRSVVLKSPDGVISRAVTGTSVVVAWTSGPGLGAFRVLVDGAVVGSNVSTANASGATGGNRLAVPLGTRGAHTVRIEWVSGGDVYIAGIFIRDGDETRGIRVTDSGQHGSSSADWSRLANPGTAYLLGQELAVVNPALVILGLGPNDMIQGLTPASHLANMRDIVAQIRSTAPGADIVLHAAYQLAADYAYPWSAYVANLATIAGETPNTVLLDFSRQLPRANANPYGMIAADGVHLNDTGDAFYAARFRGVITDPHAPRFDVALSSDLQASVAQLQTAINGKADSGHNHNSTYVDFATDQSVGGLKTFTTGVIVPVGSAAGNPVRRDDARLTDARTPTSHSHAIGDLPVASSGTSSTTQLVRADDSRLSNARTPSAHASTHASAGSDPITPGSIGAAASSHSHGIADLPVATSGTSSATQLVRADDSRLSDSRTPTTHSHGIGDLPVAASGASSTTALVRADDSRLSNARTPTTHSHGVADLPVVSSGTSSTTGIPRADDSRLSDARTPTAHKASHATGGSDAISPADIGASPVGHTHGASTPARTNVRPITGAATVTAANGDLLVIDASQGPVTANPPASPTNGDVVELVRTDSSNNFVRWTGPTQSDADATLVGQWSGARFTWTGSVWIVSSTSGQAAAPSTPGAAGLVARARRTTLTATSASTTPVSVLRVAAPVTAGRTYRVRSPNLMFTPDGAVSSTHVAVANYYMTTDGSVPTSASPMLLQSHATLPGGTPLGTPLAHGAMEALYVATFTGTLTVLLTFYRGVGTVNGIYLRGTTEYPIDIIVEDAGADPGATGASY